ncbi:dTDP-4-dehydrorhamnose reductase [Limnobacter sp. MED105]|nr:dTDP-4-dehydrorhamnose reductase [Limnobacter sp. MED105]
MGQANLQSIRLNYRNSFQENFALGIRVLVLGAQGQLGHTIGQHAKPALMETMDACISYGRDKADLSKLDTLINALKDIRPDVVINAAAYTNVEKAETETELAHTINAKAVGILAEQCKKQGVALVHYSTDYVFDGKASQPYTETDATNPLSAYGKSKLEGEKYLKEVGGNWVVFRTSWVYGQRGNNFCRTMIKLAQERDTLKVVDDQTGAPTPANWLAELGLTVAGVVAMHRYKTMGKLAPTFLPDFPSEIPSGEIFHASAAGVTTWFDYACLAIENAHKQGIVQRMPNIERASTSSMNFAAQRPAYSVLDNTKLMNTFRVNPPEWTKGVRNFVLNY